MATKKTIKEQSIEELLPPLLAFGSTTLYQLEHKLLNEVLINEKTFKDLSHTLKLTTSRQKAVFINGIQRLIKTLNEANEKMNAYNVVEQKFNQAKEELEVLKEKLNVRNNLSLEAKNALALSIDNMEFSEGSKVFVIPQIFVEYPTSLDLQG